MTASTIKTLPDTLAVKLLQGLLEEIQHLKQPWHLTPEHEQQRTIDYLAGRVRDATGVAVDEIAGAGFTWLPVALESVAVKDHCKIVLTIPQHAENIAELVKRVGGAAVLVLTKAEDYVVGTEQIRAQKDQPELPLQEPPCPIPYAGADTTAREEDFLDFI